MSLMNRYRSCNDGGFVGLSGNVSIHRDYSDYIFPVGKDEKRLIWMLPMDTYNTGDLREGPVVTTSEVDH